MNRLTLMTAGLAAAFALSGTAMAQDHAQGVDLIAGNTELVNALSTKSATMDQTVVVKLTDPVRTPAGVVLPRGTELLGRVDAVKASDKKGPSALTLTFTQARLKDGKTLAIKATLVRFAPAGDMDEPPTSVAPDSSFAQEADGSSGIALHSAVDDKSSGTLTDNRRNISFVPGTHFRVALDVEPAQQSSAAE